MSDENVFTAPDVLDNLYEGEEAFTEEETKASTGGFVEKEGFYHVYVTGVKPENPDHEGFNSVVRVDLKILAGEHEDQVDKMIFHRVRLFKVLRNDAGEAIGREAYDRNYLANAIRCAAAMGICERSGARLSAINWELALHAQMVVKVNKNVDEYDDKKTGEKKKSVKYEVFGGFWRPDDEEVADVPKDAESLAQMIAEGGGGDDSDIDDI